LPLENLENTAILAATTIGLPFHKGIFEEEKKRIFDAFEETSKR
jgi:hypothetical protein